METRLLRYFLTVAHEENITRAAEVLHITQPTLSRQLVQLEEETGVTLFIRGKRKITLTPEGMLLRRRKIHQPCKMLFKHEPISKISIGIFAFAYIIIKAPGASCRCFCY